MDILILIWVGESTCARLVCWTSDLVAGVLFATITGWTDFDVITGERGADKTSSSAVKLADVPENADYAGLAHSVLELQFSRVKSWGLGDLGAGAIVVGNQVQSKNARVAVSSWNNKWSCSRAAGADAVGSRVTTAVVALIDVYVFETPSHS